MNTAHIRTDENYGKPCIRGTEFTIAQLIAELSEGRTVEDIAKSFKLDLTTVQGALDEVADYWGKDSQRLTNTDLVNLFEQEVRRNHYDPIDNFPCKIYQLDDLRAELIRRLDSN